MEKKNSHIIRNIIILVVILYFISKIFGISSGNKKNEIKYSDRTYSSKTFSILSSQENEDLEPIIMDYASKQGYDVEITYQGTLDMMETLNSGEKYDAVWASNAIWLYMLDSSVKTSDSSSTSINPVVFAIKKSKAEELGFTNRKIVTQDIVNAIKEGKIDFSMSNPTSTNSGASAYLGLLSTLAGNPEVLKESDIQNEELKEEVKKFFTGLKRSSGDENFLKELMLNSDSSDAVVTYESSIININKELEAKGKDTLYALYPTDGVSISDSPFTYIDNKDENKKEIFTDIKSYILSNEGQKLLQEKGRRTWYGGVNNNVDKKVFNPEWGIDTTTYISPVKYPSTAVIKSALTLYQTALKKPTHVIFCLDYSGSMSGEGIEELKKAMDFILTDKAEQYYMQFSEEDKIDVIAFGTNTLDPWSTDDGSNTSEILNNINNQRLLGSTALYDAAIDALNIAEAEDKEKYNVSIVLMTDGIPNIGSLKDLRYEYNMSDKDVPMYSITFGEADEYKLEEIADLTNGKVFDGKHDLVKAFKAVRGYN